MDPERKDIGISAHHTSALRKQLGYKSEFIYPNHVRVHIPTLPYGDIDLSGKKMYVWNIMRLFDSADLAWPLPRKNSEEDTAVLYMLNCKLEIDSEFYNINSPKYPLIIDSRYKWVKRTSRLEEVELRHENVLKPYARMSAVGINMDPNTKRPIPFPEWWIQQVNCPRGSDDARQEFKQPQKPESGVLSSERRIYYSDTDENEHLNYTYYVKFCYDFFCENIIEQKYPHGHRNLLHCGLKLLQITFLKECLLGNITTLESWEDWGSSAIYHFEMKRGSELSAFLSFSFHDDASSNKSRL